MDLDLWRIESNRIELTGLVVGGEGRRKGEGRGNSSRFEIDPYTILCSIDF